MPLPPEVAKDFTRPLVVETNVTEKLVATTRYHLERQFTLPGLTNGSDCSRELVLDCFLPSRKTNAPVILILPMLGGKYPLERFFAKYFARHGLASVIVHREEYDRTPESAEEVSKLFHQTVLDNKRAIDWLETRREVDVSRLGVFGVSMGGIKGALLTPLEPRIDASVLAMPAGDVPYLLTYSTEHGIARRRAAFLKAKNFTEEELRAHFEKGMTCDPIRFAQYVDPKKVLMVLAAWDTTVPIEKGLELRAKMGKPETIVVPSGHYSAVLYVFYLRHQTLLFFKDRLKEAPQPPGQLTRQEKK
jgi:dienelactone hydrolase